MAYLTLRTYDNLSQYVRAFRRKQIGLLIIVSKAGLGKTTIVEQALEEEAPMLLNSHITPLAFYKLLAERVREEKDCLIVIDEAEMMFQDTKLKTMLKLLCDTRKEKIIQYTSTTPLLKRLPKEITTEAKVVMLLNTLEPKDEHVKAILSRGHLISFEPSEAEIARYLDNAVWAEDKEVKQFIKSFLNLPPKGDGAFSLRTYVKAVESKKSFLDWQAQVVIDLTIDPRYLIIHRIIQDKTLKKESERKKKWEAITGNGADTYIRLRNSYFTSVLGRKAEDENEKDDNIEMLLSNFT